MTSPTRPIAWLSDDIIEKRAEIVQDVLGRDGLPADAAFGEGDILGDRRIEVMAHHQHVEMLVERVDACRAASDWSRTAARSARRRRG